MGRIHVLDEQLTNMIAAGEVVDRPVNIVKECVENSLDAGADQISVGVFEGGIGGVIITDNGCGMSYDDARMAFERHATSKIQSEDELFAISTMGFRGEALPSIASVARVLMTTSDGQSGTRIEVEYGEVKTWEVSSEPAGTRIEVRGLFLHTPARFKYLKKANYEFSIIADAINKIALAHPEVRFTLKHDGRLIFQTSGKGDRREILYQMFGTQPASQAVEFSRESDDFVISGYALQPSVNRASKSYIYLSLNGRTIRSWPIVKAVIEGYREYMPKDRYPVCFLNIQTDYQLVDVNVHPNKLEVRISKEDYLSQLIINTISELFETEIEAPSIQRKEIPEQMEAELLYPHPVDRAEQTRPVSDYKPSSWQPDYSAPLSRSNPRDPLFLNDSVDSDFKAFVSSVQKEQTNPAFDSAEFEQKSEKSSEYSDFAGDQTINPLPSSESSLQPQVQYPSGTSAKKKEAGHSAKSFFRELRVIGQLKESYILCEGPDGLVIIDQHAAQERANFERIQAEFDKPVQIRQPLMVPIRRNVSVSLMSRFEELNQQVENYGLHFEPFSDTSVILREIPAWMTKVEIDGFLDDLLTWFDQNHEAPINELRRHMIATCACHSSIRFNRSLTMGEMQQVLADLESCKQPYHCPHGRPTVISMSLRELSREFERG